MNNCRSTLLDAKRSRIPAAIGVCAADGPGLCAYLNEAISNLITSGGDEGWYGTHAKVVFNVSRSDPYITLSRQMARIIDADVCKQPIRTQNPFFEFLEYGIGLQRPTPSCATVRCTCGAMMFDRGNVPLMVDFTAGNTLRFYMANTADNGRRIFISGTDTNDMPIYTIDNGVNVAGFFVTLDNTVPFVESPMALNSVTGVQKDVTVGAVKIYGVDTTTDEQTQLSMMEPSETLACYRRYFIQGLPVRCTDCDSPTDTIQVTAMVKLEFIPVSVDTDYLLIGDLSALKYECQAIRYEEMDTPSAAQMAALKHKEAIRSLNAELVHYYGKQRPALIFAPFGYETLACTGTGMI